MKRLILDKIIEWDEKPRRKPLLLMGARQVGKTWLMDEFAKTRYPANTVSVNFMKKTMLAATIAKSDIDPATLISHIQTATGKRIIPGKTLLILDEIQECPRALTSLKFLKEDLPDLAVMAAGSLLGLSFGNKDHKGIEKAQSFPVGMVDRLDVSPMSFQEFLIADGRELLAEAIMKKDWSCVIPFADELEGLLKTYFLVGGMPEAVDTWIETKSVFEVRAVQKRMLGDYDDDFKKHARLELLPKIRLLWNNIPRQLAKENKKFVYNALRSGARAREYETALQWLEDAGMIHQIYRVCPPRMPIRAYRDPSAFKVYVHDVGLLGAMSDLPPGILLEGSSLFTNFKGAMTEQFVLQELISAGIEPGYWSPDDGISEVDFVIQGSRDVYPLEVKSATNTKAKSLGVYMKRYNPPFAVKSSLREPCEDTATRSLPLYALGACIGRML